MSPGEEDSFQAWETLGLEVRHRMKACPQSHSGFKLGQIGLEEESSRKLPHFRFLYCLYISSSGSGEDVLKKKKKKELHCVGLRQRTVFYKEQIVLKSYWTERKLGKQIRDSHWLLMGDVPKSPYRKSSKDRMIT